MGIGLRFWLFIASFLIALITLIGQHYDKAREGVPLDLEEPESVDGAMKRLAESYLDPQWLSKGVSKEYFESLYNRTSDGFTTRHATMLVQVINGRIYVSLEHFTTQFSWDILRSQFILSRLQAALKRDPSMVSFEFLLNTHDCPMRNMMDGPVMTVTKCKFYGSLPVPQWFRWRDGAFGGWDRKMEEAYVEARSVGWEEKEERAVFRGALRRSALREGLGKLEFTTIDLGNWKELSRSKLYHLSLTHPDLLDVGISKEPGNSDQEVLLAQIGWRPSGRISMEDQSKRFKYVVYMEGACGWADRLKILLASGFLVFMQETPCVEHFVPLMKPMVHYVPVRNDLCDLVERIRWARDHDWEAREIAENAAEFASKHLSQSAMDSYIYHLFSIYAQTIKYNVERRPGSVEFVKAVNCNVTRDMSCDVSHAFVV